VVVLLALVVVVVVLLLAALLVALSLAAAVWWWWWWPRACWASRARVPVPLWPLLAAVVVVALLSRSCRLVGWLMCVRSFPFRSVRFG
jgi:hypothetical protein